jgi:hypothetical protein
MRINLNSDVSSFTLTYILKRNNNSLLSLSALCVVGRAFNVSRSLQKCIVFLTYFYSISAPILHELIATSLREETSDFFNFKNHSGMLQNLCRSLVHFPLFFFFFYTRNFQKFIFHFSLRYLSIIYTNLKVI